MKNRRLVLVAFLLCACMIVGVGYAAVVTSLNVDGKVSYSSASTEDYAEDIHFTGNIQIVDYKHDPITTQTAVIAAAQAGDQRAIFSASFASNNITPFANGENYTVGAVYEVEIKLPTGKTSMTVTFGDHPNVTGSVDSNEVNTGKAFTVVTHLDEENDGTETVKIVTVTEDTPSVKLYLHVQVTMDGAATNADIPDTEFEVILPINSIVFE